MIIFLFFITMSDIRKLTFGQEFSHVTGMVMNNWFALKVVRNQCNESLDCITLKIEGLYNLLITCTLTAIDSQCPLTELTEAIEDYFDSEFDTCIEDKSCEEVLHELVKFYNLLHSNNRDILPKAIAHLSDKRDIFTLEEYNPLKVIRVSSQTMLTTGRRHVSSSISSEKIKEAPVEFSELTEDKAKVIKFEFPQLTNGNEKHSSNASLFVNIENIQSSECDAVNQFGNEWVTVHSRRKQKK